MSSQTSEKYLVTQCLSGDEKAWEQIYSDYASRVKSYIRTFFMGRVDIDDVSQDVFISFFKSLNSFRFDSSVSTFLMKICKYTCIAHLRRKNALKRIDLDMVYELSDLYCGEPSLKESSSFEDDFIREEERERLWSIIPELSEDCQRVIKFRFLYSLSYAETALKLEIPIGTLCSKLKRCLSYLKKKYEKGAAL